MIGEFDYFLICADIELFKDGVVVLGKILFYS